MKEDGLIGVRRIYRYGVGWKRGSPRAGQGDITISVRTLRHIFRGEDLVNEKTSSLWVCGLCLSGIFLCV